MQKNRNTKYKVEIENEKLKNKENTEFNTRHLRNQKQMVIILKTLTYFIDSYYICILKWTIKWIICKRFKKNDYLFSVSQIPRV